jgi:hypothetical protein
VAGRGPAPKPRRQRARDEKAVDLLPAEGHTGAAPPLPSSYRVTDGHHEAQQRFLKPTREWYARWARSPMATRFTEVEWDRLRYVVAPLFDRFLRSSSKELAGELRLQESLLGGTMMDRQRMRLRIDDAEPAAQPPSDELQAEYDELLARRLARRGG